MYITLKFLMEFDSFSRALQLKLNRILNIGRACRDISLNEIHVGCKRLKLTPPKNFSVESREDLLPTVIKSTGIIVISWVLFLWGLQVGFTHLPKYWKSSFSLLIIFRVKWLNWIKEAMKERYRISKHSRFQTQKAEFTFVVTTWRLSNLQKRLWPYLLFLGRLSEC